ncbi:hypothetical protein N7G274_009972 [Stereocaulon virgatum]|uniref:BHLH domain-containing protein n=1 Tax=Stereocaulon virgatum TaxID=373712 RepID=A0ABR4A1T6_9LECA
MSTQSSTRIWEDDSPSPANPAKPAQLPSIATLTNEIPHGGNKSPTSAGYPTNRSSDTWNTPPPSTRSSAYSSGLNGYYYSSSISSPHRASNSSQLGATSHPAEYHTTSGSGAQASPGFAPQPHSLGLPTINQQYQDPSQYRSSGDFPPQESRRSSLGSQVNTGFNNLHINGVGSPYNSHSGNPSQSSIAASLQRERGIPPGSAVRNSGTSSIHHQQPMSPLSPYPGESKQAFSSRTAPIISANPMKEVYNAEKPTAGQPYAFPDPDMSNRSSGSAEPNGAHMLSRRNSDHTSITSSIITNDSKLPPGQHRLDEDPMPGTHHHSLQHKQVSSLASEADSPEANSPYSRTPALRNSHKIAERKRRTEMKQLFDALRAQIPASHGSKSSKWEILSKASDHIRNLEGSVKVGRDAQIQLQQTVHELEVVRRDNESLRSDNHHLFQEVQHLREQARPNTATAMHPQPSVYAPPPGSSMGDPSRSLPPLTNGIPAANSMQGIQYSDERR